jgi:anti-anti-sigma regulatory factor
VSLSAAEAANDVAVFTELSAQLDRSERRITACGEIDFAAVPVLADAMHQLIDLDPGDSTIDLAGVSFIAAAGLGCLVGFAKSAREQRRADHRGRRVRSAAARVRHRRAGPIADHLDLAAPAGHRQSALGFPGGTFRVDGGALQLIC